MKTKQTKTVEVEVRQHPASTEQYPCWRAIVTTARGYCYSCTWAGDRPSDETVLQAWKEDRKAFDPYRS
jgi:hypothetical protein